MTRSSTYRVNYFLINICCQTLNLPANLQVKDSSNKEGFLFSFPSLWTTLSLHRDSGLGCIILYCSTGFVFQSDILTCALDAERRHLCPESNSCHCSSTRLSKTLPGLVVVNISNATP